MPPGHRSRGLAASTEPALGIAPTLDVLGEPALESTVPESCSRIPTHPDL